MLAAVGLLLTVAAAIVHSLAAIGAITEQHLLSAAALIVALAPASVIYGLSGTIYDSPPAHPIVYRVGSSDLQEQLGAGFQAAHVWVNNKSNQYLYLPDAPDVVEPGVTRVLAIIHTDVGHASWTIPATFAVTQPNNPAGAAILIFLNQGIDISPTPGVTSTPTVSSPQVNLGQIVLAANASSNKSFNVPTGTHAIGILVQSGSLKQLQVIGGNSGGPYLSLPPAGVSAANFQGPFMCAFFSAIDASVNVVVAAGAGGATVDVVAIMDAQAQFVFDNISESTAVSLVGGAGTALGDTSLPALAADSVTETIIFGPGQAGGDGILASFKAAAGAKIAQVGSLGAALIGSSTAVSPLFGQPTTAGNLLTAWLSAAPSPAAEPTTVAAGWVKVKSVSALGSWLQIWAKPNCGNAEAAPTFTQSGGALPMFAQLAEWSGAATVTPADQTGSGSTASAVLVMTAAAVDVAFGDLVLTVTRWQINQSGGSPSYADTINNGGTVTSAGTPHSGIQASNFSFSIVPVIAAALPVGVAPWDWDAQGTNNPATGSIPSVTLAASPGKKYRVTFLSCSIFQTGASANGGMATVKDGSNVIFSRALAVLAAVGNFCGFDIPGLAQPCTVGNSVTFAGVSTTTGNGAVTIGAYLRP